MLLEKQLDKRKQYESEIILNLIGKKSEESDSDESTYGQAGAREFCLKTYFAKHRNTLSLHTKMGIMSEVTAMLIELRNNSIVYNNLRPTTLLLQQGLLPVFSDFTNAQRKGVHPPSFRLVDHFPYVTMGNSAHDSVLNEKQDSLSLGALLFYTVYGKNLKDVKSSSFTRL